MTIDFEFEHDWRGIGESRRWAIPGCVVRPTGELLGLGGIATIPDAIASGIVAAYVRPSIAGRSWPIQPAAGNAGRASRLQLEPRLPAVPEPARWLQIEGGARAVDGAPSGFDRIGDDATQGSPTSAGQPWAGGRNAFSVPGGRCHLPRPSLNRARQPVVRPDCSRWVEANRRQAFPFDDGRASGRSVYAPPSQAATVGHPGH